LAVTQTSLIDLTNRLNTIKDTKSHKETRETLITSVLLLGPSEMGLEALSQFFSPFVNNHQKEKELESFGA
jgi:hypothetical protein